MVSFESIVNKSKIKTFDYFIAIRRIFIHLLFKNFFNNDQFVQNIKIKASSTMDNEMINEISPLKIIFELDYDDTAEEEIIIDDYIVPQTERTLLKTNK